MEMSFIATSPTLTTADGQRLRLSVFDSASDSWVIVNGATGIRRHFYAPFAQFLAQSGFNVVTYDYRGIGDSPIDRRAAARARMADWGELDFARVLDHVLAATGGRPVSVVGHSVGGQIIPLAARAASVAGLLAIAAQSGWWGWWSGWARLRRWLDWHILVPASTSIRGHLPAFILPGGLPRGIALQWARWCRARQYLLIDGGPERLRRYQSFKAPVTAWSFDGDEFAPRRAVDALVGLYPGATVRRRHFNDPGIGHFGFFKQSSSHLWEDAAMALRAMAQGQARGAACVS